MQARGKLLSGLKVPFTMESFPSEVAEFLDRHHVLTLATSVAENVWCSHVFYVFDASTLSLIFSSDGDTHHAQQFIQNCFVSGGIALETREVARIEGLQLEGVVSRLDGDDLARGKKLYRSAFPMANLMKLNLWRLDLSSCKYTNNRLFFGRKLQWMRSEDMRRFNEMLGRLSRLTSECLSDHEGEGLG